MVSVPFTAPAVRQKSARMRLQEPRIAPLRDDELSDEQRELLSRGNLGRLNIFRTLVRHPRPLRLRPPQTKSKSRTPSNTKAEQRPDENPQRWNATSKAPTRR